MQFRVPKIPFFSEKSAIFRENLRKILHFFEKLGHEKNAEFVVLEIPKNLFQFGENSAKINSGNFCENLEKNSKKFSNF